LNVNLSGLYNGERYNDEDNAEKLDGYFLLDLGIEQKLTKIYRLFVKVNNLLGVDDAADAYDLDGVEYYLGIKAKF
jgi:outer membrane cobalamin receptor